MKKGKGKKVAHYAFIFIHLLTNTTFNSQSTN